MDASKLGRRGSFTIGQLNEVTDVVMDGNVPDDFRQSCVRNNVMLHWQLFFLDLYQLHCWIIGVEWYCIADSFSGPDCLRSLIYRASAIMKTVLRKRGSFSQESNISTVLPMLCRGISRLRKYQPDAASLYLVRKRWDITTKRKCSISVPVCVLWRSAKGAPFSVMFSVFHRKQRFQC